MIRRSAVLYSVPAAAELLGFSTRRTYQLIAAGLLPADRLGERRIVVPAAALSTWLERAAERALASVHDEREDASPGEGVGDVPAA